MYSVASQMIPFIVGSDIIPLRLTKCRDICNLFNVIETVISITYPCVNVCFQEDRLL